jgi:hypothetical protein
MIESIPELNFMIVLLCVMAFSSGYLTRMIDERGIKK